MDEKSLMEEILGIRSKKDRGETLLFEDEAEKNPKSDEDKKKEEKDNLRKKKKKKGKEKEILKKEKEEKELLVKAKIILKIASDIQSK